MFRIVTPNGTVVEAFDDAALATLLPILQPVQVVAPAPAAPKAPRRARATKPAAPVQDAVQDKPVTEHVTKAAPKTPKAAQTPKADGKALYAKYDGHLGKGQFAAAIKLAKAHGWTQAVERAERLQAKAQAGKPARKPKADKDATEVVKAPEAVVPNPAAQDEIKAPEVTTAQRNLAALADAVAPYVTVPQHAGLKPEVQATGKALATTDPDLRTVVLYETVERLEALLEAYGAAAADLNATQDPALALCDAHVKTLQDLHSKVMEAATCPV